MASTEQFNPPFHRAANSTLALSNIASPLANHCSFKDQRSSVVNNRSSSSNTLLKIRNSCPHEGVGIIFLRMVIRENPCELDATRGGFPVSLEETRALQYVCILLISGTKFAHRDNVIILRTHAGLHIQGYF